MNKDFNHYLINIGIRSVEFSYDADTLYYNMDYFTKCFENEYSAWKALLYLGDYLRSENKDGFFSYTEI